MVLVFQLQAEKEYSDDKDKEEWKPGMKKKNLSVLMKAHMEGAVLLGEDEITAVLGETEKIFREKGLSDFISTLTPGAQNAIYAASFAWGYENAAKYVKNAMKLEEVKNAGDSVDKSKVVIESMQKQAEGKPEATKETTKFVWGFYNEDMKESQAQGGKSETITETQGEEKEKFEIPQVPEEAVALSIARHSHIPALLYCASVQQSLEEVREREHEDKKREEMAQLIEIRQEQSQAELKEAARVKIGQEEGKKQEELLRAIEPVEEKKQEELLRAIEPEKISEAEKAAEKELARLVEINEIAQNADSKKDEKARTASQIRVSKPADEQQKILDEQKEKIDSRLSEQQENAARFSNATVKIVIERKEELIKEYIKAEKDILHSLDMLEDFSRDERDSVKKISAILPSQMAKVLRRKEKSFTRRMVLKKQLIKWLAFCRDGRAYLTRLPLSKLLKLASLSRLFS